MWNILSDPVPNDPKLQAFAKHRWCMALAAMFQIETITQPEARRMLNEVNGLTAGEMLWAQLEVCTRQQGPWLAGWGALIETIKRDYEPEHGALRQLVSSRLARDTEGSEDEAVYAEMLRAKTTPISDGQSWRIHQWAENWRAYPLRHMIVLRIGSRTHVNSAVVDGAEDFVDGHVAFVTSRKHLHITQSRSKHPESLRAGWPCL